MLNAANPGWVETVKAFMPLAVLILSVLLGMIGWFGRMMAKQVLSEIKSTNESVGALSLTVAKQIADGRERTDQVEKDFLRFQAQLPRVYVLKDDHIRHITIVEKKIDDHANTTQVALSSLAGDVKLLLRETPKRKADG